MNDGTMDDPSAQSEEHNAAQQPAPQVAEHEEAAAEETAPRPKRQLDLGEVIKSTSDLLLAMEASGSAFNELSNEEAPEADVDALLADAQAREEDNDRVFGGEAEALSQLHTMEDTELRAQVHAKARMYWRRASTSSKGGLALSDSYDNISDPGADQTILNPERLRRQLKELLGVVVQLSDQHAELIELVCNTKQQDEEIIAERYQEEVASILAEYDVLAMEHDALSKVHFKKRNLALGKMRALLLQLDELNERYGEHDFLDLKTREIPSE